MIMRDVLHGCTGDGGMHLEDSRDYCLGWKPKVEGEECVEQAEYT